MVHEGQGLLCPSSLYTWPLSAEGHEQMSRSGGQSDAKPPLSSSQASLVLIYRPTEGMKDRVTHVCVATADVVRTDTLKLIEVCERTHPPHLRTDSITELEG
ncbi:hypothetical protein TNCV_4861671 [Trichonephila clavipes]|nr:hypothetical protein TNCV_4861671 [Trichonephila clavipes]